MDVIKRRKMHLSMFSNKEGSGGGGGGERPTHESQMYVKNPWTSLKICTQFLLEFQSKVSKVSSLFDSVLTNSVAKWKVLFVGLIPRVSPLWGKTLIGALA